MKKFTVVMVWLVVLAMALTACAPQATPAPVEPAATQAPAPTAVPAEPFRVAVVMPSKINDLAFSQIDVRCPHHHPE